MKFTSLGAELSVGEKWIALFRTKMFQTIWLLLRGVEQRGTGAVARKGRAIAKDEGTRSPNLFDFLTLRCIMGFRYISIWHLQNFNVRMIDEKSIGIRDRFFLSSNVISTGLVIPVLIGTHLNGSRVLSLNGDQFRSFVRN